jgi:hypothetical protein
MLNLTGMFEEQFEPIQGSGIHVAQRGKPQTGLQNGARIRTKPLAHVILRASDFVVSASEDADGYEHLYDCHPERSAREIRLSWRCAQDGAGHNKVHFTIGILVLLLKQEHMSKPLHFAAAMIFAMTVWGCTSAKHSDTVATVQPKDPDRVLYEKGLQAFAAQRYGEGIALLETLTATYPESPYAESANIALKDCAQSKSCGDAKAVIDHGGGQTFFPNMPESSPQQQPEPKKN